MNKAQAAKFIEGFNAHIQSFNQVNRFGFKRDGSECARRIILARQIQGVENACDSLSIISESDIPAMLALEKEADQFFEANAKGGF
ncbi:MAG TPA: hypothetical protein VIY48_13335 [Candidatus Paceibacterota bacterium]